jgi:hypothetical protein
MTMNHTPALTIICYPEPIRSEISLALSWDFLISQ